MGWSFSMSKKMRCIFFEWERPGRVRPAKCFSEAHVLGKAIDLYLRLRAQTPAEGFFDSLRTTLMGWSFSV